MANTDIFYSGTENALHWKVASKYSTNILMSYWYLQGTRRDLLKQRKQDNPDVNFMIDSGGFTLQLEEGLQLVQQEDYLKEYVDWLQENREYIYSAVELDLGELTGIPKQQAWREKFFRPLEASGIQIIYIWHNYLGEDEWARMCREYRYVGINRKTVKDGSATRRMMAARRHRTKIHGFAITSSKALRTLTMSTADSTTWKDGERYGLWLVWDGRKVRFVEKEKRDKWKTVVESQGFDWEKLTNGDAEETSSLCIYNFRIMEDSYNQQAGEPYWDIRTPYPEVVAQLTDHRAKEWMHLLALPEAVDAVGTPHEVLTVISCIQNSRLEEYKAIANADEIMGAVMEMPIEVFDDRTLLATLDEFNGMYAVQEPVKPRLDAEMYEPKEELHNRPELTPEQVVAEERQYADDDYELQSILEGHDNACNKDTEEEGSQEARQIESGSSSAPDNSNLVLGTCD